jgi:hypothetical protein
MADIPTIFTKPTLVRRLYVPIFTKLLYGFSQDSLNISMKFRTEFHGNTANHFVATRTHEPKDSS